MKILILCDYFEPVSMIGAVRPSEFAKCFVKMGHNVDVITLNDETWHFDNSISSKFNIQRINIQIDKYFRKYRRMLKIREFYFKKISHNASQKCDANTFDNDINEKNIIKRISNYLRAFYSTKLKIIFGKCGAKGFYKVWKQNNSKYDIVYTTYGGFSSVLAGEKIKRKCNIKWIVDFRDAVFYKQFIKANKSYFKYFIKNHCLNCDSLVFASEGYKNDSIIPHKLKNKISIIENGFMDYRDEPRDNNTNLTLLYSGSMYGDRHLSSIFQSIRRLEDMSKNLKLSIVFCGNTESYEIFKHEAKMYHVEKYIIYKGYLPSSKLFVEENNADAFLISSWNYKDYSGVLPGKLFEYMSFRKPIIGHVSGDLPDSEIKHIINDNNLGYCADEIDSIDQKKMYNYFLKIYHDFIEYGKIQYSCNMNFIDCYRREKQAKRLLKTVSVDVND